jgi:hypothetical protein
MTNEKCKYEEYKKNLIDAMDLPKESSWDWIIEWSHILSEEKVCTSVDKCFNTPPCFPCNKYNYPLITDEIMEILITNIRADKTASKTKVLRAYVDRRNEFQYFVTSLFNYGVV